MLKYFKCFIIIFGSFLFIINSSGKDVTRVNA